MARTAAPRRQKYGNVKGEIDGFKFDSKAEGERYLILRDRLQKGEIMDLEVHPSYRIEVGGVRICRYVADFSYHDPETYSETVEDVKGVKTAVYQIKKKLMKAVHGIEITEVMVR